MNVANWIFFQAFLISFNAQFQVPHFSFERVTHALVSNRDFDRNRSYFYAHARSRARHWDYTNSGFHRGHLTCVGNHQNTQHNIDETFCILNCAPITPELNYRWMLLEDRIRTRTARYHHTDIYTGTHFM